MNPTFNKKTYFYDYFPHISPLRMKNDFGLGLYEQCIIRDEMKKAIHIAYEHLVDAHDLRHANVYGEIGEEFDDNFYKELKNIITQKFNTGQFWEFLDNMMPKTYINDPKESANFNTRLLASLEYGLPRTGPNNAINLKDALVALFNADLAQLNGREILYLTKIE